ncbi:MAG: SGNH/GDSL hydrolase family protein [Sedimentisphaerales bacterium]|nr:SGNH/GDSL hydrolase family protein [Sedimentisphaerales bacterium]
MQNGIELKPNQTILFIGDSITDAERNSRAYKPFGLGYIHFVANFLLAKFPAYNLNIINRGISGNTVRDLKNRWQRDCLNHKPDILSILIGVNDVWRQFFDRPALNRAVFIDEFETTYRQLLTEVRQNYYSRLIICEPFMFCDNSNDPVFAQLRRFIEVVHKIAADFNALLVPFQKLLDEQIKTVPPPKWSLDMVHPEVWARAWLAQQWLTATGI